ncbi:hypothetical protein SAMD00019534_017510 [Acytostelium subglobosum LB1]|uniref:hypothetical protein n=1 Tax=Acytostelium subglobosum LB1 TaxID=1410327 RepID=UPI0006450BD3|nr:hypothetical protein SAMD00019534_017510 [Acytostelium subglobosum LB1]GAM18576.1 hypothetical protein SAMD00019534_017510 [Acytostelium subglobosum LB1]|eukprot:XP_012757796.1 hypothetical protein SAMD00019534_017510 [Acytostelium subglobosum LB1]
MLHVSLPPPIQEIPTTPSLSNGYNTRKGLSSSTSSAQTPPISAYDERLKQEQRDMMRKSTDSNGSVGSLGSHKRGNSYLLYMVGNMADKRMTAHGNHAYTSYNSPANMYIDTMNGELTASSASHSHGPLSESAHSASSYLAYTTNNTEPIDVTVPLDHNTPSVNVFQPEQTCTAEHRQSYMWNEKFQYIVDMEESELKYQYMAGVAKDFVYCANTYGKIIISERSLPDEQKTILPKTMGGVAGGTKYKCHGIIFKFVVDVEIAPGLWMYGDTTRSDEKAKKSAGHELKGLNHFMDHSDGLIRFPLMAIIDYRGYRLLAISNLPITKESIVYGSNDGGKTVHNSDPLIEAEMKRLAKKMFIKGHTVGLNTPVTIFGPGDIEVHKGTDGRYYMIDFARAFPPEYPAHIHGKIGRQIFYSMLRPELLLKFNVELSPDAFSGWQTGADEEQNNQDVIDITTKYHNELIPEVAGFIQQTFGSITKMESSDNFFDHLTFKKLGSHGANTHNNDFQQKTFDVLRCLILLHSYGVNLRYLGSICSNIREKDLRTTVFTEVIARVWKRLISARLRDMMDKTNRPSDESIQVIAEVFDFLLNPLTYHDHTQFWSSMAPGNFKFAAMRTYPNCLSKFEMNSDFDLRNSIDCRFLVASLIRLFNVKINSDAYEQFLANPRYVISRRDILEVESTVKYPIIIDFAAGSQLLYQVKSVMVQPRLPPPELMRWLEMGQDMMHNAHLKMPMSASICLKKAAAYIMMSNLSPQVRLAYLMLKRGICMMSFLMRHPCIQNDPPLLALWGMMYHKIATYYLFYSYDKDKFKENIQLSINKLNESLDKIDLSMIATPYLKMSLPNDLCLEDNPQYIDSIKKSKVYNLLSFAYLLNTSLPDTPVFNFVTKTLESITVISHLYIPEQLRDIMDDSFMASFFTHLPNVTDIVLTDTIIEPETANAAALLTKLRSIELKNVNVASRPSQTSMINSLDQLLFSWLGNCPSITTLHLGAAWLKDETLEQSIPLMANLENLALAESSITDKTLIAIAQVVNNLQTLSLRSLSGVSDTGVNALMKPTLTSLSLSLPDITDAVGINIAAIAANLKHLDLSGCVLLTAQVLTDILAADKDMEHLDITRTQIEANTFEALEMHGARKLTTLVWDSCLNNVEESSIATLSMISSPLKTLRLPNYSGEYAVLWNLFNKLPYLETLRMPSDMYLPAFIDIYRAQFEQNDQILVAPLKSLQRLDVSKMVVSLESLSYLLDLCPLVESLLMDSLQFVNQDTKKPVIIDDNVMVILSGYFLNLKELDISNFPVEKYCIGCILTRCESIRRVHLRRCPKITENDLAMLQLEYPHVNFIGEQGFAGQSPVF